VTPISNHRGHAAPAQTNRVTATRPVPTTIPGRSVRLQPVQRAHLPALFLAIGHPVVFAGGYGGGASGYRGKC